MQQKRSDKNKIYSLHEPFIECISKGKEHKKYEFGNKVSIIRSQRGVILGALSFRNEYDGHTIDKALEQTYRITGKTIKILAGDTQILIPTPPLARDSRYQRIKKT